jgi:L-ascorbate metabolism protein UlaG (beta-lactamase superfamily)
MPNNKGLNYWYMLKSVVKIMLPFALLFFSAVIHAQVYDKKSGGGKPDPQLSQKDNDYLNRQDKVFLDTINSILSAYPPAFPEYRERSQAKLLMDAVFHEHSAVYRAPVQQFFRNKIDRIIKELETTSVEKGVRIWKVYNMGFIARTKTVTIAFDLVTGITGGTSDFAMSRDQVDRLVKQCDALLISHWHPDHADKIIAQCFLDNHLPVVAPEQVWANDSIHPQITHLKRIAEDKQQLRLRDYSLDIIVYPGHQMKAIDNNVYLITTPEGFSLAHLGDQINEGDFMVDYEWIDRVAQKHKVDVLMPNAWTTDIFRIVRGFDPKLVMPGHEIEMGHTVWDRLPYWGDDEYLGLNYEVLKKSKYPVLVTIWGESYHYLPRK